MSEPPPNSIHPLTRDEWRAWLEGNHTRAEGIWLISYKKAAGKPTLPYEAAVEEALCFGWIDGQAKTLDDKRAMLWYAPRKMGSGWARTNKERVERLIAEGRMAPAGLAKVEAAKADGSWTLLDAVENLEVPDDLTREFDRYPDARAHWEAFPRSAKRAILVWIVQAKRPETRAKRVEETARLAQKNVQANQWRPK
ncbi:MAG TPA: YdeI/OmpD-associated family protein [Promineifilum sp.]